MQQQQSTLGMVTRQLSQSPMAGARSVYVGLRAALRAPLWVSGRNLRSALEADAESATPTLIPDRDLVVALRVANGAVRHLSRTHTAWRNTCLYRSVAECLVLRRYGVPAMLRIGVKSGDGDIEAHAWVVRADRPSRESDEGHQPLVLRA